MEQLERNRLTPPTHAPGQPTGAPPFPMKLQTTLAIIRAASPCASGYAMLLRTLGADFPTDKPIDFATILASNGLQDALWALRAVLPEQERDRDRLARLFAADCAEWVLPLFEQARPGDTRPREAITAARAFARGEIGAAVWAAARAAARDAVWDAAKAAAWDAAGAAAEAAARAAAWDAAMDAQSQDFIRYFCIAASDGGMA